jgi:hypothetical protein
MDADLVHLRRCSQNYNKFIKSLRKKSREALSNLRSVLKESHVDTIDAIKQGEHFIEIETGIVVVASTVSDTTGRRYIKYPNGEPAGTIWDQQLLDSKLFRRSGEKRDLG